MKIKPFAGEESIDFDGIDEIYDSTPGRKQGRRKQSKLVPVADDSTVTGGQFRRKPRPGDRLAGKSHDTEYMATKSMKNQVSLLSTGRELLCSAPAWKDGTPYVVLGLLLSGAMEMLAYNARYNYLLIAVLAAGMRFSYPLDSLRPQLCTSSAVLLSFLVDAYDLLNHYNTNALAAFTLLLGVCLCKGLVLLVYLHRIRGARRCRKYLDRRLRLFCIPLTMPRRIMRDIRGRLLALCWLQGAAAMSACVALSCYLLVPVLTSSAHLLPNATQAYLPWALGVKCCTSSVVLGGLLYDTDLRLCLWQFGCLAFRTSSVVRYIAHIKTTLRGYPLSFSFYALRWRLLLAAKGCDAVCGAAVAALVLGPQSSALPQPMHIYLSCLLCLLLLGDGYTTLLFLAVQWLWRRQRLLQKADALPDSDDSELDDFGLRGGPRTGNPLHTPEDVQTSEEVRPATRVKSQRPRRSDSLSSGSSDDDDHHDHDDDEGGGGYGAQQDGDHKEEEEKDVEGGSSR